MFYRYVNAIFAHKLLVMLPLIVIIPMSVFAATVLGEVYTVSATFWVDSSPLLVSVEGVRGYQQPNEVEAESFNEWLGTKLFVQDVIDKSGLRDQILNNEWPKPSKLELQLASLPKVGPIVHDAIFKSPRQADTVLKQAITEIRKSIRANPQGARLVMVSYKGSDPQMGMTLVTNAISVYNERITGRKTETANSAVEFYQAQLDDLQIQVQASSDTIRAFEETHPLLPAQVRPPADEQELGDLRRQYTQDSQAYDSVKSRLEQARLNGAADIQNRQTSFRIADPPEMPTAVSTDKKKIVMFGAIGMIVGLILGLGGVLVAEWFNNTVRSAADLPGETPYVLLTTIPHLSARGQKKSRKASDEGQVRGYLGALIARKVVEI